MRRSLANRQETREELESGRRQSGLDETDILTRQLKFRLRRVARRLQDIVAGIAAFIQEPEKRWKIGLPGSQRHGAAFQDAILDMHAADQFRIRRKFILRPIAQRRAVAGVVIDLERRMMCVLD